MSNLATFRFSDLQSTLSVLHALRDDGSGSIDDAMHKLQAHLHDLVREERGKRTQRHYTKHKAKIPDHRCEKCGGPVYLQPVNVSRCTRTGDNSKTAVICYDEQNCGHIEYSERDINSFQLKRVYAKADRQGRVRFFDAEAAE